MILGIVIGILATVFILMIIGMYIRVLDEIKKLQTGVVYLVKREYEFEQSEIEIQKEMQRNQDALNRVNVN